jgi:hypothetical protein
MSCLNYEAPFPGAVNSLRQGFGLEVQAHPVMGGIRQVGETIVQAEDKKNCGKDP